MSDKPKLYADRDSRALGQHYLKHVEAMTVEGLHSKADIADELAWRDVQIESLTARVAELERDAVMMKKIDGLTKLEPGWDGYRGVPLPARTAEKAKEIFQRLPDYNWQVVPGGDGSVQFEYHGEEWDIEVSIIDAAREVKP